MFYSLVLFTALQEIVEFFASCDLIEYTTGKQVSG
jgi:hypothetical protein